MNIDCFLDKKYNAKTYNCGHYVAEVYEALTGRNIDYICEAFYENRDRFVTLIRDFKKVEQPEECCIAVMKMQGANTHAGIYLDNRILHLSESGPRLDEVTILSLHYKISYFK